MSEEWLKKNRNGFDRRRKDMGYWRKITIEKRHEEDLVFKFI
jgi:hypothetical protein